MVIARRWPRLLGNIQLDMVPIRQRLMRIPEIETVALVIASLTDVKHLGLYAHENGF